MSRIDNLRVVWEVFVPSGEGRHLDVFRACFVGAKNAKVVEALRIVYVDCSVLWVAGVIIFRLMSAIAVAGRRVKRK